MEYNRKIIKTIAFIILFLVLGMFLLEFSYSRILKIEQSRNDTKINQLIQKLTYKPKNIDSDIKVMKEIMDLKHLSDYQIGCAYAMISSLYYISGDINQYFDNVGYAIFHLQRAKSTDEIVYTYSDITRYFFQIGSNEIACQIFEEALKMQDVLKNQNPYGRLQILIAYANYYFYKKNYIELENICNLLQQEANKFDKNTVYYKHPFYTAKCFRALVLLEQNKINEANEIVNNVLNEFTLPSDELTRFYAFDIYMPVYFVKIKFAIANQTYKEILPLVLKYGKMCDGFSFFIKKIDLEKFIIENVPTSFIKAEKDLINTYLTSDYSLAVRKLLNEYSYETSIRFRNITTSLHIQANLREEKINLLRRIFLYIIIMLILSLVFVILYNEMQIDGLTLLKNRRAFNKALKNHSNKKSNLIAIMIDIDNFKSVNDTYGHEVGDEVLKGVAEVILHYETKIIRGYRYGGEEFVILLEKYDIEHTIRFAETIRSEIAGKKWNQKNLNVTASLGIGHEKSNIIQQADENMYYSKKHGKNFTCYEENGKKKLAERRLDIRTEIPTIL